MKKVRDKSSQGGSIILRLELLYLAPSDTSSPVTSQNLLTGGRGLATLTKGALP